MTGIPPVDLIFVVALLGAGFLPVAALGGFLAGLFVLRGANLIVGIAMTFVAQLLWIAHMGGFFEKEPYLAAVALLIVAGIYYGIGLGIRWIASKAVRKPKPE